MSEVGWFSDFLPTPYESFGQWLLFILIGLMFISVYALTGYFLKTKFVLLFFAAYGVYRLSEIIFRRWLR